MKLLIPVSNTPKESGFYLCKSKQSKVWQLIVKISGFAPFMYVETVNALFKESDNIILQDWREAVWSEQIDMGSEDVWYGYTISNQTKQEAIDLIKEGLKLNAVKLIKVSTKNPDDEFAECMGLKDAKEYVDKLCFELQKQSSD